MLRSPPKHEQEDIKTWNRDQTALREGGRTEAHVIEGSWADEIRVSRRIQWTCKWVRFDEYDDGSDGLGLWRRMQLFGGCIQTAGGWVRLTTPEAVSRTGNHLFFAILPSDPTK